MGATGHIGRVIVEELLKRGHVVRAIGRNVDKLHQLDIKGANLVICEFDDVETLTQAFTDAYAVFSFIPPGSDEADYEAYQDRVSSAICQAIREASVKRLVNLSSLGANLPSGTGPIAGLHRHEERLNALNCFTTLIHLRPTFFMENLNEHLPQILNEQQIRSCIDENLPLDMVATRDIGWKAADFLDSTADFPHLVFEFVGPKPVTMWQVTELFANVLDMPELHYQQISLEEARWEWLQAGMNEKLVAMLIEMYKAFNTGLIVPTQELTLTHHGTTTIQAYIQHMTHKLFTYMH